MTTTTDIVLNPEEIVSILAFRFPSFGRGGHQAGGTEAAERIVLLR